jgi:hypothetical protein
MFRLSGVGALDGSASPERSLGMQRVSTLCGCGLLDVKDGCIVAADRRDAGMRGA